MVYVFGLANYSKQKAHMKSSVIQCNLGNGLIGRCSYSILCFGFLFSGFFAISKTGFAFTLVDRFMQCFSSFLNVDICFVSRLSVRDLNVVPSTQLFF